MQQERRRALVIAGGATAMLLAGVLGGAPSPPLMLASVAVAGWCFVIAFLGWSHRHLSFGTPLLRDLSESAFPVYLLHQAAIVIPGYFLIQLPLGLWTKFVLLLLVSTSLTLSAYRMLVRPFALTRFLCGMKAARPPGRRRLAAVTTAALLAATIWAVASSAPASGVGQAAALTPVGLRGFLGVPLFGRTTTWLRVGAEARTCLERSASSAGPPGVAGAVAPRL